MLWKMTSSYHGGFVVGFFCFFFIFFFLSPCQGFLSGKIRSDPFHEFIVFLLSQLRKVQFIYIYFLISIFVGATAQHPQHTDDKGRGPERQGGGFTNIVPEEEKEGTIRRKWKREESREEKKRGGRETQQYQQFHLEFSWFHHEPSIDCFRQLQLNIKLLLSKRREDWHGGENIVHLRQMTRKRQQMKRQERWVTADWLWITYCILVMCIGEFCQSICLIY